MPKSSFPVPPQSLREKIGEEGYQYLKEFHEHVYGVGDEPGQLDAENLAVDGAGRISANADGTLQAGQAIAEGDVVTTGDGPLVSVDGKMAAGNVQTNYITPPVLHAPGQSGDSGQSLRADADGAPIWHNSLETPLDGAATLSPQATVPTPPSAGLNIGDLSTVDAVSDDARMYIKRDPDVDNNLHLYVQVGKNKLGTGPDGNAVLITKPRTVKLNIEGAEDPTWASEEPEGD